MRNRNDRDNDFGRRDYQHQEREEPGWQGAMREHQGNFGGDMGRQYGQDDRRYQGNQFQQDDRRYQGGQPQDDRRYQGYQGGQLQDDRRYQGYQGGQMSDDRRYQGNQFQQDDRRYQGGQMSDDRRYQQGYQGSQMSDDRRYQGNPYQGNPYGYEGRNYPGGGAGSDPWAHNIGPMGPTQGMSFKGRGPKGYKRTDQRIEEDINDRLMQQYHIDASDVEVKVQNGEVTLTGTVTDRNFKHMVENLVDAVAGVQEIHNQLRVKRQGQETTTRQTTGTEQTSTKSMEDKNRPNGTVESKHEARTARS